MNDFLVFMYWPVHLLGNAPVPSVSRFENEILTNFAYSRIRWLVSEHSKIRGIPAPSVISPWEEERPV